MPDEGSQFKFTDSASMSMMPSQQAGTDTPTALTRSSTSAPCTVRCAATRSTAGLFLEPPLGDVVHVVAQVQVGHALQVGVDDVDFLGVPEEDVGQVIGHERLQLDHCLFTLARVS